MSFTGTFTVNQIGPKTFHRALTLIQHNRKRRKSTILSCLMLTPMVDMFTLLVIFLLQVFSTSPQTLVVPPGMRLPRATQAAISLETRDVPVLTLTQTEVFLGKSRLGTIDQVLADPTPLAERLKSLRDLWQRSHPQGSFPGDINVEAHSELPSTVVSRIMEFLPSQEFGSIQLITIPGGGKGG